MIEYLSVSDFIATKWGAGLSEIEAAVYVEYANAVIERAIDPTLFTTLAGASARARAIALRIASIVRKNFDRNESVSIGGKLSVSFATEEQIETMARTGLGDLAVDTGSASGVSFAELER